MFSLKRSLLLGFVILSFSGVAQDAFAGRFGLQTGFYNESIKTPCANTREFGLRLGFYADKTTNDILYASALNGTNICGGGGGGGYGTPAAPMDCGCGCSVPVFQGSAPMPAMPGYLPPPGCSNSGSSYYSAPVQQAVSPTKTEIYLLVLPESKQTYQQQPPAYYPPPMADYGRPPQGYYREPSYQEPVRGYW